MKLLVIGGGGREHALAWKLSQSKKVQKIYLAPGNAGTALNSDFENIPFDGISDIPALLAWAQKEHIELTVVGPEAPLAAGVVDAFTAAGMRIFGPTQAAAQLESSKAFSKAFMQRHAIPTARYQDFTDAKAAHDYVNSQGAPIVVKADGLAAGKGVVVAMTAKEAHEAIDFMLGDAAKPAGSGQNRVVIEEYLEGEEASFIVLVDGVNVLALATSQDHKRLMDGDLGPNTGGMGAYSPAPIVTPQLHAKALREVIMPVVRGMQAAGTPYKGFLYAGLMISPAGEIKTLEFNCRMGDPETQPIMLRLKSDLLEALLLATEGRLKEVDLDWERQVAVGVVMAAAGYPLEPRKGDVITGLPATQHDDGTATQCHVFHAGTKLDGDHKTVLTNGGRVLCVTALGGTLHLAQQNAYDAVKNIHFDGEQYRKDIGHRAQKR